VIVSPAEAIVVCRSFATAGNKPTKTYSVVPMKNAAADSARSGAPGVSTHAQFANVAQRHPNEYSARKS
jgi:hypothetical protein